MQHKILTQLEKTLLQGLKSINNDKKAQTSVEMILLIGAILTICLITGTYIYKISSSINSEFSTIIEKARNSLINKI